jgi:hypothetical protein
MKIRTKDGAIITLDKTQIEGDPKLYGKKSDGTTASINPSDIVGILEVTFWDFVKGFLTKLLALILK